MKKIIAAAGTALALTLSSVALAGNLDTVDGPALAERGERVKGDKRMKRHHKAKFKKILRYLDEIGVEQATQDKIKAEMKANKPEMKKLREAMKQAKQTGDPLLIGEAKIKMMEKRLEAMSDLRKYLTDAQWTQVTAKMKEGRQNRRERHMQRRQQRRQQSEL